MVYRDGRHKTEKEGIKMAGIRRELRIPFQDAKRVAVVCKHCGGEVIIDLENLNHVEHIVPIQTGGAPCPLCGQSFGQELRGIIVKLHEAFMAPKSSHEILFCVTESAILRD